MFPRKNCLVFYLMSPTTKCTLCDWAFYTDGIVLRTTLLLNAFLVDYKQCFLYLKYVKSAYFPTLYAVASVSVCL